MATEGKKMADAIVNPKRNLARREEEAGLGDPKNGTDAGDLPGPNSEMFKGEMSQAQFSQYPTKRDGNKAGLEKALKNRK
jgi:hypothetical protein